MGLRRELETLAQRAQVKGKAPVFRTFFERGEGRKPLRTAPVRPPFQANDFSDRLSRIAIPRHAASLASAVKNFSPKDTLPGAVNVSFADNHVETVRLEKLWNLNWHKTWVTPLKRPGR